MKRLRQIHFILLTGAVLASCVIVSLMLPQNDYIRYQSFKPTIFDKLIWVYERIHFDDAPIDVAFLGSSRCGSGVNALLVEQELQARCHKLKVVNLSIAAVGLDVRSSQLHNLLSRRKIKLLVYSVDERLPRDGHQAFGDLATVSEILTAPMIVNRTLPKNVARLPFRQMELALASLIPEAFGYHRNFDESKYLGTNLTGNDDDWKPQQMKDAPASEATVDPKKHDEEMEIASARYKSNMTPPILPSNLSFIEFGVSRHYLQEIKALSEKHGFQLVLLYQPFYKGFEYPLDQSYLDQFGPMWRSTFLMNDAANFLDVVHASPRAADQLAPWLADRIVSKLEASQ